MVATAPQRRKALYYLFIKECYSMICLQYGISKQNVETQMFYQMEP